jgi:hypothetical protein
VTPSKPISARRIWLARIIAILVDGVQIGLLPLFLEGMLSPADAVLDVITAVLLTLLVGWHIAFLPAFIIEGLPFADIAPSWTIAVLIATRGALPNVDDSEQKRIEK